LNGEDGAITINRSGTGRYTVTIGGIPAFGNGNSASVSVSTYGSSTITCAVANFNTTADSSVVDVFCWDNVARRAADSRFSILLVGTTAFPGPSAFLPSGGAAPLPPPSPDLSWTSGTHAQTVTHNTGAGDYSVNLGVGNAPQSAKLVTAGGPVGGE